MPLSDHDQRIFFAQLAAITHAELSRRQTRQELLRDCARASYDRSLVTPLTRQNMTPKSPGTPEPETPEPEPPPTIPPPKPAPDPKPKPPAIDPPAEDLNSRQAAYQDRMKRAVAIAMTTGKSYTEVLSSLEHESSGS